MKGVKFGEYHTYDTWGLLMTPNWEIGLPEVKEKKIDIEGADGEKDYTEFFGGVKYGNRTLKWEFVYPTLVTGNEFMQKMSAMSDVLHGRSMPIILDDDSDYVYTGRARVVGFNVKDGIGMVEITAEVEPYKMKVEKTTISAVLNGSKGIYLGNSRKSVVPEITTDTSVTIKFGENTFSHNAGTFRIPELQLEEGENLLTVTGTGNITFEYREGRI